MNYNVGNYVQSVVLEPDFETHLNRIYTMTHVIPCDAHTSKSTTKIRSSTGAIWGNDIAIFYT